MQCAARVRAARAEISRRRQFAQEMQSASRAALEAQIDYERKQRAKAQKREQELLRKRDRIAARRAQLFEAAAEDNQPSRVSCCELRVAGDAKAFFPKYVVCIKCSHLLLRIRLEASRSPNLLTVPLNRPP